MSDRVIIESPFAGNVQVNVAYAQAALLDSLFRGEAPIASHLLHTQVLDDLSPEQRHAGIEAGLAWMPVAHRVAFYVDLGWSSGMIAAKNYALSLDMEIVERHVGAFIPGITAVRTIGGAVPFGYELTLSPSTIPTVKPNG